MAPLWFQILALIFNGVIAIIVAMLTKDEIFYYIRNRKKNKRHNPLDYYENEKGIMKILQTIKEETKAKAISLWGFQNGKYFTSDYPEMKFKCMYQYPEEDKYNIDISLRYKEVSFWKVGRLISRLSSPTGEPHYFSDEYKYRDGQRVMMEALGYESYLAVPILDHRTKDVKKKWVHTLIIGWSNEHYLSQDQLDRLQSHVEHLKTFLLV